MFRSVLDYFASGDIRTGLVVLLSGVFVIFTSLSFHELAHAFIADKQGDPTARYQGRMTINPMRHLDPIGSLMILFVGFGWAKPVPVNPRNLRHPRRDMALVSLAGPVSNLILAFFGVLIFYMVVTVSGIPSFLIMNESEVIKMLTSGSPPSEGLLNFFYNLHIFLISFIFININLAIFNLIPVPPLDGSKILAYFLPPRAYETFIRYEQYFPFILILLMVSGILSVPISFITDAIFNGFSGIFHLIFRLFW